MSPGPEGVALCRCPVGHRNTAPPGHRRLCSRALPARRRRHVPSCCGSAATVGVLLGGVVPRLRAVAPAAPAPVALVGRVIAPMAARPCRGARLHGALSNVHPLTLAV